jgi:hypothetical protein
MPGMLLSVGAAPAGAGTAASAPRTATAPDAAARQEAQVLGEVLGRLRSLEGETARLAEAQRAAEARHAAAVAGLERRVGDLEAERDRERDTAGEEGFKQSSGEHPPRRLQAPPTRGDVVHIHRTNVSLPAGPGWDTSPNNNGGHRRSLQQSGAQCGNMATRAQQVQARCCDEATEDCSGGYPRTCNAGCAAVFLPFWTECGSLLGNAAVYQQTVSLCQQAQPTSAGMGRGLAHEFNLVCADGAVGSCVPACSEVLRGDLLLMNLNGEDSKYSCELHHGLHSWVGAATEGGYLGSDVQAFVSAVLSGAAGYYALQLTGDAGVAVDIAIGPGQEVRISGTFGWGGGFTVQQGGSISLMGVALAGALTVQGGGNVTVTGGSLGKIGVEPGGGGLRLEQVLWQGHTITLAATQNLQCYQPYAALNDAYRATSTQNTGHYDCAGPSGTGVGGGRWYRFLGVGGDALPLQTPGNDHCGTGGGAGWLSGWGDSSRVPDISYNALGHYPAAVQGVAEMTVCFDSGGNHQCRYHVGVGVVMCDGFLLWRLPYAPVCDAGYCTVASGL